MHDLSFTENKRVELDTCEHIESLKMSKSMNIFYLKRFLKFSKSIQIKFSVRITYFISVFIPHYRPNMSRQFFVYCAFGVEISCLCFFCFKVISVPLNLCIGFVSVLFILKISVKALFVYIPHYVLISWTVQLSCFNHHVNDLFAYFFICVCEIITFFQLSSCHFEIDSWMRIFISELF